MGSQLERLSTVVGATGAATGPVAAYAAVPMPSPADSSAPTEGDLDDAEASGPDVSPCSDGVLRLTNT